MSSEQHNPATKQLLRLEKFTCIRNNAPLFQPLNLTLDTGQSLHLQSTNGTGKTTLLKALYGLAIETIGNIYWKNTKITSGLIDKALYINDKNGVFVNLTVLENLEKMTIIAGQNNNKQQLQTALDTVGLIDYRQRLSQALSKGQIKRLHIARLLLIEKPLWLLDEPFDGLDSQGEKMLINCIDAKLNNQGAIMYTSHLHRQTYSAQTTVNLNR